MFAVGIDPGENTGVAVWDTALKYLRDVKTVKIHQAMRLVEDFHRSETLAVVVFEDARLRRWFGDAGRERLQGVGSIKRDCAIWAEFLGDLGVAYKAVKPVAGSTKLDRERWERMTGYTGRTSEHARDAAMLVLGM